MTTIKNRIRKLLSLARNSGATVDEAAVALEKASNLMLEHNIAESEIGDVAEIEFVFGNIIAMCLKHNWQYVLANAVAYLFDVKSVDDRLGNARFVGRLSNVEAAEVTLPWLHKQVDDLYRETLKAYRDAKGQAMPGSMRTRFKKSFHEAAVMMVGKRIAEIKAAQAGRIPLHKSLMVLDTVTKKIEEMLMGAGAETKELAEIKDGIGTGAGLVAGGMVRIQNEVEAG